MEPLLIVLVPGVFGGLLVALVIASRRTKLPGALVSRGLAAPTPALINMAAIKVEGIGGLGMVAAVLAVAIADPRIRLAIMIAAVLGVTLALGLILIRRRTGALPSSGGDPDDRSTLHLEGRRGATSGGDAPGNSGNSLLTGRLEGAFHVP